MDRDRVWEFLDRFTGFAAGYTTIGLLAMADRTGLLTAMADGTPNTAETLANAVGIEERYATEILSGLTAAEVVVYDPGEETFRLPPEHAAVVADDASPYSMSGWLDTLPALSERLPQLIEAAATGGGVAYRDYGPGVVEGIDRANSPGIRVLLTKRWLPAMPDVVDRLSTGATVIDVGCGSGTAAVTMATTFPESQFLGIDVDQRSIGRARQRAGGLSNVEFRVGDAADLDAGTRCDLITAFDVVHDLPQPIETLRAVRSALADNGVLFMMEPNVAVDLEDNIHPRAAFLYGISAMLCMPQSLAEGGMGLGAAWGPRLAEQVCREAGFTGFEALPIENPFSSFYRVES